MKTTSLAATEYADSANPKIMRTPDINDNIDRFSAFKAGVEFAQRWIPIEDELPELLSLVLCISGFSPFVAIYHGVQDGFRIPNVDKEYKVSHWRPIEIK